MRRTSSRWAERRRGRREEQGQHGGGAGGGREEVVRERGEGEIEGDASTADEEEEKGGQMKV